MFIFGSLVCLFVSFGRNQVRYAWKPTPVLAVRFSRDTEHEMQAGLTTSVPHINIITILGRKTQPVFQKS